MAELIIKVGTNGSGPAWQDGDVIHAWNNRDLELKYLENDLCHPWNAPLNASGLIDTGTIYEDFRRHTYRFKFEQLTATTFRKTNLVTLSTEDITTAPEATKMKKWLDKQLIKTNPVNGGTFFPLFGTIGAVVWYRRQGNTSQPQLNLVWADVEDKTAELQVDHRQSTLSQNVLKKFLVIDTTNFNQSIKESYEAQELDEADPEAPILIKRRTHFVDYSNIGGIKPHTDDIRNRNIAVDLRLTITKVHGNIVSVKQSFSAQDSGKSS